MILRDAMFVGGVVREAFLRPESALAGHAAFKLGTDFLGGALFKRIGAAAGGKSADGEEKNRSALHRLILGGECLNASEEGISE